MCMKDFALVHFRRLDTWALPWPLLLLLGTSIFYILFRERDMLSGAMIPLTGESLQWPRSLAQKCTWNHTDGSRDRNFTKYKSVSRSQQGEDAFLWSDFGDVCGGSYIELGALDGITFSNTHAFSKALDWSGVLIEASPGNAAKLSQNRPNDICVNAAVCQTSGIVHYVEGAAVGGIWEFMADGYRSHWHKGKTIANTAEVSCRPLADIVKMHTEQTFFDLLSLDVEGGEFSVIQTLGTLEFGVIIVEADGHDRRKNSMFQTFLSRTGYILTDSRVGNNQIYIHSKFDEIYKNIIG